MRKTVHVPRWTFKRDMSGVPRAASPVLRLKKLEGPELTENHRKTMGKPWENDGLMGFNMVLPFGNDLHSY